MNYWITYLLPTPQQKFRAIQLERAVQEPTHHEYAATDEPTHKTSAVCGVSLHLVHLCQRYHDWLAV